MAESIFDVPQAPTNYDSKQDFVMIHNESKPLGEETQKIAIQDFPSAIGKGRFLLFGSTITIIETPQANQIVCGLLADGVTFIPFGQFLGGDVEDPANYNSSPMTF